MDFNNRNSYTNNNLLIDFDDVPVYQASNNLYYNNQNLSQYHRDSDQVTTDISYCDNQEQQQRLPITISAPPEQALPMIQFETEKVIVEKFYDKNRVIQDNYPFSFVTFHVVFLIILSFAQIAIQVIIDSNDPDYKNSIKNKTYRESFHQGIYSGSFFLINCFFILASMCCGNFT